MGVGAQSEKESPCTRDGNLLRATRAVSLWLGYSLVG